MKINTKVMAITEEQQKLNMQENRIKLEQVQYLNYLVVTMEETGKQDIGAT